MAFKIPGKNKWIPSSTIELFNKLGTIERLSLQQGQSLGEYDELTGVQDIAIEMPAGHGKTLVGGLIGEFNRISKDHRVVYCCATKQLAAQTNELLESYGINSVLLVGKRKDFSEQDYRKYKRSIAIAVTTYSHIFNINSAFKDSHVLIFDDAHATEYSINDLWTLEINKSNNDHKEIFNSFYAMIRDLIPKHIQDKIDFDVFDPLMDAVDILPQPLWIDRLEDIRSYLNQATDGNDLYYSWSKIRDLLHGCQFYIGRNKLVIKPLISPNRYHATFNDVKERIYMSATLGSVGELERVFGVSEIRRISHFSKGENKVSGRRLILFPEDHFEANDVPQVLVETIRMQPRILMLFPSKEVLNSYKEFIENSIPDYTVFLDEDVEHSLDSFKNSKNGILLLAGRYEGIDLKDSECRLQIFVDLPVAVGISEQFLHTRLRVTEILKDRLATRLIQGLGRCTRGTSDYAAVLFLGKSVGEYLYKNEFRQLLPPEIEAEMEFGFGQIDSINDLTNWRESLTTFYDQGDDWEEVEDYIRNKTDTLQKDREKFQNNNSIEKCADKEIQFQYSLFEKDYEQANKAANEIITILGRNSAYKGYRAWWNYNIACNSKQQGNVEKSREFLEKALDASPNKLWLDREVFNIAIPGEEIYGTEVEVQLEAILNKLLSYGDRDNRFDKDWAKVLSGIKAKEAVKFEPALRELGTFLGMITYMPEGKGTPDGIWNFMDFWAIFEAKTNIEDPSTAIPLDDIRQTGFHDKWLRTHFQVKEEADTRVCMLCEKSYVEEYARHATDDVYLVSPSDFIEKAIQLGDILRTTIQKLKHGTYDEAKSYLAFNLAEKNLTIFEFMEWLKEIELKNCVKS